VFYGRLLPVMLERITDREARCSMTKSNSFKHALPLAGLSF
jgi:hypothetical protein